MDYKFKVKTADEYKAGTDSNIFVVLEGEFGKTEEKRLNGYISGNAFERNDVDEFTVPYDIDVGRVFRIILRSDMMYAGAGWRLGYIEITRKKQDGEANDDFSNIKSRFDINEWIENKSAHTYTVAYEEWSKNVVSYESVTVPYKKYTFMVPANGDYTFDQTETVSNGFSYSNTVTKKSTTSFNQKMSGNLDFTTNSYDGEKLTSAKNYKGYLEFAFSQGFESSEINEVVKTENKTIQKTVKSTVKNASSVDKRYEACFSIIRINALTSTGGIVAMFSANESIEFAGFHEVTA